MVAGRVDEFSQRWAVDQLHHEVVRADVVQRAHVGVVQCRNGVSFSFKPIAELLARQFDRDVAADASIPRPVDGTHPASTELPDDFVRTELVAG